MAIKALILTNKGIEKYAAKEAEEYGKALETHPGFVIIETTKQKLAHLTYWGRTINKTVELLKEFEASSLEEIKEQTKNIQEHAGIECDREGAHEFTSFDVQQEIGKNIKKLDFKNPETKYFILVKDKKCYFGIDYAGIDLGKRDYRIFLGRESLRGNIAAALLKIAEYEPKDILLDPYCKHGEIAIEAALIGSKKSVNNFIKDKLVFTKFLDIEFEERKPEISKIYASDEQFNNVSAAKKNAKIAGINKNIQFSRQEVEWLDTKIDKVNKIVTMPTQPSQSNEKKIDKIYAEFFRVADDILSKKGKIVLCMKREEETIMKHAKKFKLKENINIMQGKESLMILVLER